MEEDYLRIEGFNTLTAWILDVKTFRRQYKNIDHPTTHKNIHLYRRLLSLSPNSIPTIFTKL